MLYCLSFGSLNFREAEELLLGVTSLYYKCNNIDYNRQSITTGRKQMFSQCIKICKENHCI